MTESNGELLRIEDVAMRLGMSISTVRRLAETGRIPGQVPGIRGRWRSVDLDRFLRGGGLELADSTRVNVETRPDRFSGRE